MINKERKTDINEEEKGHKGKCRRKYALKVAESGVEGEVEYRDALGDSLWSDARQRNVRELQTTTKLRNIVERFRR